MNDWSTYLQKKKQQKKNNNRKRHHQIITLEEQRINNWNERHTVPMDEKNKWVKELLKSD